MNSKKAARGRGRPKKIIREDALHVAMMCHWTEGTYQISVNEICRRANVSKPSLYREFGSEDGLMEAVLDEYRKVVMQSLLNMLKLERSFSETLNHMIDMTTDVTTTPAGCIISDLRYTNRKLSPKIDSKLKELVGELKKAYEEWVHMGIDQGEVRSDIPIPLAVFFIDTQFNTILQQVSKSTNREMLRAQARLAFRALLHQPGT